MRIYFTIIFSILLFSCSQNVKIVSKKENTPQYRDPQKALAEMAKTWTQEERDAFRRDFFYSEDEINKLDSLINKK